MSNMLGVKKYVSCQLALHVLTYTNYHVCKTSVIVASYFFNHSC